MGTPGREMVHFEQLNTITPVSRETYEKLCVYVELLEKWQRTTNLVGPKTLSSVWNRHIADSLQLLPMGGGAKRWIDFGSGAGFPALVVAICGFDEGVNVTMVESIGKKAAFLREVARATEVRAEVHCGRIEEIVEKLSDPYEVVTARALTSLSNLISFSHPLLARGAIALFPKGQDVDIELTEATRSWNIRFDRLVSLTDSTASVLRIFEVEPKR